MMPNFGGVAALLLGAWQSNQVIGEKIGSTQRGWAEKVGRSKSGLPDYLFVTAKPMWFGVL